MKGVLISNLGSPDDATPEAVDPYLKQFLMDPYVIDAIYPLRYILVNWLIVPKRKFESAEAYEQIWTKDGSPLVSSTRELTKQVRAKIQDGIVEFAMRYGQPSLDITLKKMIDRGVDDLLVMPLYPQYAWASTTSTEEECKRLLKKFKYKGKLSFTPAFYKDPDYIQCAADIYKEELLKHEVFDHYLFSYHGIPERHLKYTDPSKSYCLSKPDCCQIPCEANRNCYKHHCWVNTELISSALSLPPEKRSMAFQSRLGKDPWIKPFTDIELVKLAEKGVRRLAIFSPSFVADCLETIEELGMRGKEDFIKAGGKELLLVPSLNSHPRWVETVSSWTEDFLV
ncbi:ferrochelatase [bacterium]|nr:ferrochelatase [bacterium]